MIFRVLVLWFALAVAAFAVQPDEVLSDPVLEERARDISKNLRCLVCRNESIDESNADLARDLRLIVRERLVAGDSDEEAVEFIVSRFGEYVLLRPQTDGSNLLLWGAGPFLLVLALVISLVYVRRRSGGKQGSELDESEKARLAQLLDD